jgi:hypothetical protein
VSRITWDDLGKRFYEVGIDRGVLYPPSGDGVPWNGLTSVRVHPSGGDQKGYYLDGIKYLNVPSPEEYEATITAFTYPDEFGVCDGTTRVHSGLFVTQQQRKPFGFSYRTRIGNELDSNYGYKIHIVYNALAAPSNKDFSTLGGSVSLADFSWDITTKPAAMTGVKRSAHIEIDTRSANPAAISDVEDILYGTEAQAASLPTLAQLVDIFEAYAILSVIDNGDGTFTVTGPDDAITFPTADTFEITWPSAVPIDADTFTLSSL